MTIELWISKLGLVLSEAVFFNLAGDVGGENLCGGGRLPGHE